MKNFIKNNWEYIFVIIMLILFVGMVITLVIDFKEEQVKEQETKTNQFLECMEKTNDHLWCWDRQ